MTILRALDDLAIVSGILAVIDTAHDRYYQRREQRRRDERDAKIADMERRIAELEAAAKPPVTP